jgi:MFS family permease
MSTMVEPDESSGPSGEDDLNSRRRRLFGADPGAMRIPDGCRVEPRRAPHPDPGAGRRVSLSTGEWILTATLLTGALATPVMGRLADGPRQRTVILLALSAVVVGCVLSAVSNGFILLIIGRALQGVGLGLLPAAMAIARRNLPSVLRTPPLR